MTERHLDQWLGEQVGEAARDDVLGALRGHILGDVIVQLELPDGGSMLHVHGTLLEAGRDDPGSWETADVFAIDPDPAYASSYHAPRERWDTLRERGIAVSGRSPSAMLLQVPETGIEQYPGVDAGASGYRFDLGGGVKLAVMLWHGFLHVTGSGDVAPGIGGFTAEVTEG